MTSYQITDRDIQVVVSVYKYRYLTTSQIQRLHFATSAQMAYRRLRILDRNGYLMSFTAPGIDERLFGLDQDGADLAAEYLRITPVELNWIRPTRTPKDYYFLRHFVELNDFRITLTRGCEGAPDIGLLGFIPEYYGERTSDGGVRKYIRDVVCDIQDIAHNINHTPDAVTALQKDGNAALFFIEIDRGTEVVSNEEKGFLKAIRFYLNYLVDDQKKYQRYTQDFRCAPFKGFRVLFVTTSDTRLTNMRQAVSNLEFHYAKAKRFIWLTTFEQITTADIFQPIWRSADTTDTTTYSMV